MAEVRDTIKFLEGSSYFRTDVTGMSGIQEELIDSIYIHGKLIKDFTSLIGNIYEILDVKVSKTKAYDGGSCWSSSPFLIKHNFHPTVISSVFKMVFYLGNRVEKFNDGY